MAVAIAPGVRGGQDGVQGEEVVEYDDGVRAKLNSVLVSGRYTEPEDR
ncbi:hypothetical protein JK361_35860 [Streptomyces sp. 5-8]|uniref:Uncharacterized protein n=1 Tax=Streptomyces musisoli TaxID=2802280 RepID=A0ABS1PCX2_9ACTN|nr:MULTISPECIES: hypothetical protein [Streptomyces]MBL1109885.1 hypothetical protein [Streptomyces musisoli]MBY8846251.1 hypothetical protein [Streptomyces sp. SP2-10]